MSVLVKDMRFPNYCSDCEFSKPWGNSGTYCSRHPEKDDVKYGEGKPDWCPLDTVVHCKDCKYCEHTLKRPNVWKPNETSDEHYNCMRKENVFKPIVFPDSFCSFGKRGDMMVTL